MLAPEPTERQLKKDTQRATARSSVQLLKVILYSDEQEAVVRAFHSFRDDRENVRAVKCLKERSMVKKVEGSVETLGAKRSF